MKTIKVAATSRTSRVAGAIAHSIRENGYTQVQGIGAGAVNQMVKATILAKGYLSEEGTTINFTPAFTEVEIDGEERTALCLTVEADLLIADEDRVLVDEDTAVKTLVLPG